MRVVLLEDDQGLSRPLERVFNDEAIAFDVAGGAVARVILE